MLGDREFTTIRDMIYDTCWINLSENKRELVKARLSKRLRALNLESYGDYIELVLNDSSGQEFSTMVDTLTTNLTSFFREDAHFDYLEKVILKDFMAQKRRKLRIWSAGCSTGEEALSIAITLKEAVSRLDSIDASILATDVSSAVLDVARQGIYPKERLESMPKNIKNRYFKEIKQKDSDHFKASDSLLSLISYRRHNLAGKWPMNGPFDVVFCRNVMIYFDKDAKKALLERFLRILRKGGVLFVGHSESLSNLSFGYQYIAPGIYRKI